MHPLQEPQVNLDHIRKIHDLPIEILDMIFDFLRPSNWDSIAPSSVHQHPRGTHNDLAACHAVSRLWREHTRKHFFRDFTIIFRAKNRPPQMFTGPMAATLRELHSRSQLPELPAFYPSLEGHPFIARCIRRLRLHGEIVPKDCACLCDSAAKYIPKIEPALLLGILRSIPNLRVLHLSNVVLTALPASRLETPLSCLQISYTCASHFGRHLRMPDLEITQVLNCFARVNELSLLGRGLSPKDPADVRHYHGPSGLQVKKFVLQRRWNRGVLFKHLAHASLENVRCLVLQGVSLLGDIDLELFPAFLCTIGPRLEEFRIYLTHDHHHVGVQVVDVTPCYNLKELTIGFTLPIFVPVQCQRALGDAANILSLASLSQNEFPSLREIVLEITLDAKTFSAVSDPDEDWISKCTQLEALDSVLSSTVERCGPAKIWVECMCLGEFQDPQGSVARMLPQLHDSGHTRCREHRNGIW